MRTRTLPMRGASFLVLCGLILAMSACTPKESSDSKGADTKVNPVADTEEDSADESNGNTEAGTTQSGDVESESNTAGDDGPEKEPRATSVAAEVATQNAAKLLPPVVGKFWPGRHQCW